MTDQSTRTLSLSFAAMSSAVKSPPRGSVTLLPRPVLRSCRLSMVNNLVQGGPAGTQMRTRGLQDTQAASCVFTGRPIKRKSVDLSKPETTVALLKANAVVGVKGVFKLLSSTTTTTSS